MVLFLVGLASCTSRSGHRDAQTSKDTLELLKTSDIIVEPNVKVWKVMHEKENTAFEFIDYQDFVWEMKINGLDSIHLSRTTIIHSDTSEINHIGNWVIPFDKNYEGKWTEYNGNDTISYRVETLTLPSRSFILKE